MSKCFFNFMAEVIVCSDFGAQENKVCHCFHLLPCLRLLIFLPAILTSTCDSSSLAFCMIYSVFRSNKQDDNIQSWHIPCKIWNQSAVPCLVLIAASWSAYIFLRREVRWSSSLLKNFLIISLRSLFKNFLFFFFLIDTVEGFSVVNEAKKRFLFYNYLAFLWSKGYWQFGFWFLCLF